MVTSSKYLLPKSYFQQVDVVALAQDLIGKIVLTRINNKISAAIITETEAYAGVNDKASHSYGNKRTKRTETMYLEGGCAYIYLIYGIHHLMNIVTNRKDIPQAVLIRGAYPVLGLEHMRKRNDNKELNSLSLIGPGRFSKLMGIKKELDSIQLMPRENDSIWVEDWGCSELLKKDIEISKRIGIDYAEEDALLPYRFFIPPKSEEALAVLKKIGKPIDH